MPPVTVSDCSVDDPIVFWSPGATKGTYSIAATVKIDDGTASETGIGTQPANSGPVAILGVRKPIERATGPLTGASTGGSEPAASRGFYSAISGGSGIESFVSELVGGVSQEPTEPDPVERKDGTNGEVTIDV